MFYFMGISCVVLKNDNFTYLTKHWYMTYISIKVQHWVFLQREGIFPLYTIRKTVYPSTK